MNLTLHEDNAGGLMLEREDGVIVFGLETHYTGGDYALTDPDETEYWTNEPFGAGIESPTSDGWEWTTDHSCVEHPAIKQVATYDGIAWAFDVDRMGFAARKACRMPDTF